METGREKTLQAHFASSTPNRPTITSLNGDNSWLLSFPRPDTERAATGRAYYHMVFEPWLEGPAVQFSTWLIHIMLPKAPAFVTPDGIAAVVRQIEAAAAATATAGVSVTSSDARQGQDIDAIFLGFHYSDHVHERTLRLFDSSIPVIATPEAQAIIKPWNHFTTIRDIASLDAGAKSWQGRDIHPGEPLPSWLTPVRMLGHHELNYVMAIIWTHAVEGGKEIHEAILQSPHGTRLDVGPLEAFLESEPKTEKLALLHGLKESRAAGWKNTYGAEGGLALYRRVGGTKYWVASHSSSLWYSGVIMRALLVKDTARTVQWALDKETQNGGKTAGASAGATPNFLEVENGDCFVLA